MPPDGAVRSILGRGAEVLRHFPACLSAVLGAKARVIWPSRLGRRGRCLPGLSDGGAAGASALRRWKDGYAFSDNMSVRGEWLNVDLGDVRASWVTPNGYAAFTTEADTRANLLRIGVDYKF